ncbi:pyruvate formate-lyase-activating protein [Botrimarina mediterranea]|nr:pyruvate formate-lyase-activating protein [Botrimarina mediterranea]
MSSSTDMPPSACRNVGEPSVRARGSEGYVFSHDNASAVDGPGLRYVVWLMGCIMRCQYCHNPDSWQIQRDNQRHSVKNVLADVERYGTFLRAAGGGFTVSGGEPLVQAPFAMNLLRGARRLGLHTALDTNGYLGARLDNDELADIDLVLLDLKAFGEEHHRNVTGVSNRTVLEFARRLADLGRPAWVRFVLVPGLTDDEDDIRRLADFAARLTNVERLEVLPFHQMGRRKWRDLKLPYALEATPAATHDQAEATRTIFREAGCRVG